MPYNNIPYVEELVTKETKMLLGTLFGWRGGNGKREDKEKMKVKMMKKGIYFKSCLIRRNLKKWKAKNDFLKSFKWKCW